MTTGMFEESEKIIITDRIYKKFPPEVKSAYRVFAEWERQQHRGRMASSLNIPPEVKKALEIVKSVKLPGYEGKTGKDTWDIKHFEMNLYDVKDCYLNFLEHFFWCDSYNIPPDLEETIHELLQLLGQRGRWVVNNEARTQRREHLDDIVKLRCGFDGKSYTFREIGQMENLHGGKVVTSAQARDSFFRAIKIVRSTRTFREFRSKIAPPGEDY